MKRLDILLPLGCVVACGQGGPSYMPLVDEKQWTYNVVSNFQNNVQKFTVAGHTSVGGVDGRVISSEMGESRLAWDRRKLICSEMGSTVFIPPIPIFMEDKIPEKKKGRESELMPATDWSGTFQALGKTRHAKGILSQSRGVLQSQNGDLDVVETVFKVQIEGAKDDVPLEIRTWFARGIGIVRQEQRTDRNLVVSLELLR